MDDKVDRDQGASLVGILALLVVLAAMGAAVFTLLNKDLLGTSDLSALTQDEPGAGPGSSAPTSRPRSPAAGATSAACTADVRTLEQAAAVKHAADGAYPTAIAELVAGHWISEAPALRGYELTLEVVGGTPTGRILVNGLPADRGCNGEPRPAP